MPDITIPDVIYKADALLKTKIESTQYKNQDFPSNITYPDGRQKGDKYYVTDAKGVEHRTTLLDAGKHPSNCGGLTLNLVNNWCYDTPWKKDVIPGNKETTTNLYKSSFLLDQYYNTKMLISDIESDNLKDDNGKKIVFDPKDASRNEKLKNGYLENLRELEKSLLKVANYTVEANRTLENFADGKINTKETEQTFKRLTREVVETREQLKQPNGIIENLHNLSAKLARVNYSSKDRHGHNIDFVLQEPNTPLEKGLNEINFDWKNTAYAYAEIPEISGYTRPAVTRGFVKS